MYNDTDLMRYAPYPFPNGSELDPMQQRLYERYFAASMELAKDVDMKRNRAEIALQMYEKKLLMKEDERELKKAQYEDLGVENGIIQVTTCNLRNVAVPMRVANFQQPELDILRRITDDLDIAYRITFVLGGCSKTIFLDKEKAGRGGYLLQKFASEGAFFNANSIAKKKEYATMLLAYLLSQKADILWVADDEGWAEFPGIGIRFVGQGGLTWKKICKLSR